MNEIVKDVDIVADFLTETQEGLAQVDLDLITLEKDPANAETLACVFRTIHTIKGTAGFLGLSQLEAVAHSGEGLLSRLRDGQLAITTEMVSALLSLVDAARQILADIEAMQSEGTRDHSVLIQTLQRLQRASSEPAPSAATTEQDDAAAAAPIQTLEPSLRSGADGTIRVDVTLLDKLMNLVGELVLARNQIVQFATSQQDAVSLTTTQHLNLLAS